MRTLRYSVTALAMMAGLFLTFPIRAQKVETDYNHSANFSQYHTYSWGRVHATDPLFEDRIRAAVDRDLQAKGWQRVDSGGDATVTAIAVRKSKAEYTTFYDGFGPGWGWHGWGPDMATTTVENIPLGTLAVDIYDSSSHHLLWRGLAHDQLSDKPEKNSEKLDKAVDKLFEKFPPRSS